ncbi:MAG TPA: TylF/MycF/NovP-related O-methyltransferase [Acidobacteriota bacterium]|jgi:hypothetical protein|nr:TylF/MycF/NovP-related O-methyltransferase [Acidobacteriota bacterium]
MSIHVRRYPRSLPVYDRDCLHTIHNHDFIQDPEFIRAYERGVKAGGCDIGIQWRVHVALWAARTASVLEGDYVECGVNKGIISSAIMEYLKWNSLNKCYYLFDTFAGIDPRFVTEEEKKAGKLEYNKEILDKGGYQTDIEQLKENFAEWKNVNIVKGAIPEILPQVNIQKIAFVHLDMNCAIPEYSAVKHFWPNMVPGALILLDDYAYFGYQSQKDAMDEFARETGITILSLPTGQGLAMKPFA